MAEVRPDVLKRLADLVDGDAWHVADLLAEEFPPEEFGEPGDNANHGLHQELADYEHALVLDYGIDLKAVTMARYRTTSLCWPPCVRTQSVPFAVCNRFHGEDRFATIERYLKRNKGRPLTVRAAIRYRAEDAPTRPAKSWESTVRRRIESAAKATLLEGIKTDREDWWNAAGITDSRRKVVIDALRKLASEMAG